MACVHVKRSTYFFKNLVRLDIEKAFDLIWHDGLAQITQITELINF